MKNLLSFLLGGLALVLAGSAAQAQEKLVIGYTNFQSAKMPLPLAKEAGLFAKHGLDVTLVQTPGNAGVPKLVAGDIDIFVGNGDPVVKAIIENGAKLALIGSMGEDSQNLVARASIRTSEELKGKRIGVTQPGSSADRIARLTLSALKLDPDRDVEMVATGLTDSVSRLKQVVKGETDATIAATESVIALGEQRSQVSVVAVLEDLGIFISGSDISTTRRLIETRRPTVKRFLAALVEAIARAKADPDLSRRIYRDYSDTKEEAALDWRVREFVPKRIASDPSPNRRAMAFYFRDLGRGGPPDFAAVADFSLLQEIAAGTSEGTVKK
jgi:NitT/TauT family transport system substrate-binding protein